MNFSGKIENCTENKIKYSDYSIEFSHLYSGDIVNGRLSDEQLNSISIARELTERFTKSGKTFSLCVLIDNYNSLINFDPDLVYSLLEKEGLPPDHICFEAEFAGALADTVISTLDKRYVQKEENDDLIFNVQTVDLRPAVPFPSKKSFREIFFEFPEKKLEKPKTRSFRQILSEDGIPRGSSMQAKLFKRQSFRANTEAYLRESYQSRTEILLRQKMDSGYYRYSCPLLASCWYLSRLGVPPFLEVEKAICSYSEKSFFGKNIITVLPASYLKIEATVYEILSASRQKSIRRTRDNFIYYFY